MLVFGSMAIKRWFPDFAHESKDIDVISPVLKGKDGDIEYHWCDELQYVLDRNIGRIFVDPNFLYTIKVSHAAWDINWDKHMKHIIFLKRKGCVLDKELYSLLYKRWEILHGKKKVKMSGMNHDFFTPTIDRKYDHDWLHKYLAFYDRPLHERIRKDLNSPMPSKDLWDKLSYEDQIKCALEETYVIATERYLFNKTTGFDKLRFSNAKIKSLKNLVTSMSKGWFNLFLIENFGELYYNELLDSHWKEKIKGLA